MRVEDLTTLTETNTHSSMLCIKLDNRLEQVAVAESGMHTTEDAKRRKQALVHLTQVAK